VLGGGGGRPEEAGQLAGARHDDHVVRFPAGFHPVVDVMDPLLRGVRDRKDMLRLSLLTVLERRTDPWLTPVMPGRLDQQPASEPGPGLRDRTLTRGLSGLRERGCQPEPGAEAGGFLEPLPVRAEL
jgi:hypothetical protein